MSSDSADPRFETVDWSDVDQSRRLLTAERATLLGSLLLIAVLYLYDTFIAHVYLVMEWKVGLIDWLFMVSSAIILAYLVIPLWRNKKSTGAILRYLRSRPLVFAASVYLVIFVLAGVFGPLIKPTPGFNLGYQYNPPAGLTSKVARKCAGPVTGTGSGQVCRGAIRFPLGTAKFGKRVEYLVLGGATPALYVVIIGGTIVIPISTAVGVAAGLRGGLLDKVLMTYVDLQLSIPAILIYVVAFMTLASGASLLLFLFAFGLLSWGGIARLVRSEVIQRRERGHVTVARSLGASELYIAKRHIIPNVTNTLIPAAAHLLALLVLYQAGLAFIGFHEASVQSWGSTISQSVNAMEPSPHLPRAQEPAWQIWWVSTFPAIALTLTMVSLKLVGDGLRDALDPRGEH